MKCAGRNAKEHGVEIRPVCVNASHWDCTLEPTGNPNRLAVRLGMRMVRSLANTNAAAIVAARCSEPFAGIDDLWRRAQVPVSSLVHLAEADAFLPSFKMERREALWAIKALRDEPLPLFEAADKREMQHAPEVLEPHVTLKPMTAGREVVEDYRHIGLTLRQHPISFLRDALARKQFITCKDSNRLANKRMTTTAGLVLVRQKPGSAKGVMFITIEDETGVCNLVIWPSLYERQRRVIIGSRMLGVYGQIQREGEVVHLVAHTLYDLSPQLASIGHLDTAFPLAPSRGDEVHHGIGTDQRSTPKGRDIYIPDLHVETLKVKARDFK